MKTNTKISVDRFIALPVAWLLNSLARILRNLLRRDHSIGDGNVRTIVISKYIGMGSIIQATPLIRSMRATFPRARLIFVTGQSCRRMVERLDHVDRIITVDDRGLFPVIRTSIRTLVELIWSRPDLYFDLEVYSAYSCVMSLLSLSRNRIGFYRESAQHKRGSYTHLMYFTTGNPIRHVYLQLGRTVGCRAVDADRLGPIRIDDQDRNEVADKLQPLGIEPQAYFVINPNASDLLIERRWPVDRFRELIERLLDQHNFPIILIGVPAERPFVSELASQVRDDTHGRLVNLAGELSLGGLLALLEQARCLITNDTGPMHLGWALQVPCVCLFGPGDPQHYGWQGPGVEIISKPVYCSPCLYHVHPPPCNGNNICMQRITVDEVMDAVGRILEGTTSEHPDNALATSFFYDQHARPLGYIVRGSMPKTELRESESLITTPPPSQEESPDALGGNVPPRVLVRGAGGPHSLKTKKESNAL